jgi:hypothetical protein
MDDLMAKLQEILGSKEGQQQLKSVAQMLGMDMDSDGEVSSGHTAKDGADLSGLENLFASLNQNQENTDRQDHDQPDLSGIDLNMLANIQKVVKTMNTDDDNTRLLLALKPHFSEKRRAKVDQAIQMLRLFSLLPMIQESGLLGGLLGNGGKSV